MMDFGCHRLEVLMHLFGAVRRTAAVTANVVFDRAVEDTAAVLLQFEGGPCAAVDGHARGRRTAGYAAGVWHARIAPH